MDMPAADSYLKVKALTDQPQVNCADDHR